MLSPYMMLMSRGDLIHRRVRSSCQVWPVDATGQPGWARVALVRRLGSGPLLDLSPDDHWLWRHEAECRESVTTWRAADQLAHRDV